MDDYHIIDVIGHSDYSKVYKCRKRNTLQIVAIKVIEKSKLSDDVQSLLKDLDKLKSLNNHSNVIKIIDVFITIKELGIVTELQDTSLLDIIRQDKLLPEPIIQSIASQLISGIYFLHSNRITHGDLKPSNVLLDCNGQLKITDCLISNYLIDYQDTATDKYRSPEQLILLDQQQQQISTTTPNTNNNSNIIVNYKTDMWSLGVILYQMAFGSLPSFSDDNQVIIKQVSPPQQQPRSNQFIDLLQYLLTIDLDKRITWPDLLHHPFIVGFINSSPNSSKQTNKPMTPPSVGAVLLKNNTPGTVSPPSAFRKSKKSTPSPPSSANNNGLNRKSSPSTSQRSASPINTSTGSLPPKSPISQKINNSPPQQPQLPSQSSQLPQQPLQQQPPQQPHPQPQQQQQIISPLIHKLKSPNARPSTPMVAMFNNSPMQHQLTKLNQQQQLQQQPRPSTPVIVNNNQQLFNRPITPNRQSPKINPPVGRAPPTPNEVMMIEKLDIEGSSSDLQQQILLPLENKEYWIKEEQKSLNEQILPKLIQDKFFFQKLCYHLQTSSNIHMDESNPIGPSSILIMLKIVNNLYMYYKKVDGNIFAVNGGGSSGNLLSSPATPPLHSMSPQLQAISSSSSSSSSLNLLGGKLSSNDLLQQQQVFKLFKRDTLFTLTNVLSNIMSFTNNNTNNQQQPTNQLDNQLITECIKCIIFNLDLSPPLLTTLSMGTNRPISPLISASTKKSNITSTSSQMNLLISIFNYLSKQLILFNFDLQLLILNLINSLFKKMGESPIQLMDLYKKILEDSDIIKNLGEYYHQIFNQHLISTSISYNDNLMLKSITIQCLVSFLYTSTSSILEFPMNSYQSPLLNNSNFIYQAAGSIIGDGLGGNQELMDDFYQMMYKHIDQRYYILQIFLHCTRSSRLFTEFIHKEELLIRHNRKDTTMNTSPTTIDKASLFEYLDESFYQRPSQEQQQLQQPIQQPISICAIQLMLGTILVQIPETIEWMITYDLEYIVKKYFSSTNVVLSSCSSFFIASFLTVTINIEKNYTLSNSHILMATIEKVVALIPLKSIRKIYRYCNENQQQQQNGNNDQQSINGTFTLRDVEGGCLGRPFVGLLDGCSCILLRLLKRDNEGMFLEDFLGGGTWESVCHELASGAINTNIVSLNAGRNEETASGHLSPSGVIYTLRVVYEVLSKSSLILKHLSTNGVLSSLITLLQPRHIEKLREWPSIQSGGLNGVVALVQQIMYILFLLDSLHESGLESDQQFYQLIKHYMIDFRLVKIVIHLLPHLPSEFLDGPMSLLSTLAIQDNQFTQQFIESGGLDNQIINLILNVDKNLNTVLSDTLLILNQIARQDSNKHLYKSDLFNWLGRLLNHSDANIRSKTCHFIGNLFRSNSTFYQVILSHNIIPILIEKLKDQDINTRKFACIAIGNAACHSDELYLHLEPSIDLLTMTLDNEQEDEKTRSNAAGALGNLVRNSNLLCHSIIQKPALSVMLKHIHHAPLTKNILFSIGNFCTCNETRMHLVKKLNLQSHLTKLANLNNPNLDKYITRVNNILSSRPKD